MRVNISTFCANLAKLSAIARRWHLKTLYTEYINSHRNVVHVLFWTQHSLPFTELNIILVTLLDPKMDKGYFNIISVHHIIILRKIYMHICILEKIKFFRGFFYHRHALDRSAVNVLNWTSQNLSCCIHFPPKNYSLSGHCHLSSELQKACVTPHLMTRLWLYNYGSHVWPYSGLVGDQGS